MADLGEDFGGAEVVVGGVGDTGLEDDLFFLGENFVGEFSDCLIALGSVEGLVLGQLALLGVDLSTSIDQFGELAVPVILG